MSMFSKATDGAVEQFYLQEDLSHTKIAIFVAIFFCLVFIRNDYLFFGISPRFFWAVLGRGAFVLLSAGALVFLQGIKNFRQHERLVFAWVSLYILLCNYINLTRQDDNINFTYLDTLVVVLILIYFPGNLWTKFFLSACQALSDLAILEFVKTPKYIASLDVIFISYVIALLLGIAIASKLHKFRYDQYYALIKEHNMRLELEKVAYTDYLTGALNRRKFFQLGEDQFNLFAENGTAFSILMLDVDYFKQLNDNFGHAAGDAFLQALTRAIAEHSRPDDILGRLGGEEFALILAGAKLEFAIEIAERLRTVCNHSRAAANGASPQTTVSIGVAEVGEKDRSFAAVLKRADDALYRAKSNGRNQVQAGNVE